MGKLVFWGGIIWFFVIPWVIDRVDNASPEQQVQIAKAKIILNERVDEILAEYEIDKTTTKEIVVEPIPEVIEEPSVYDPVSMPSEPEENKWW